MQLNYRVKIKKWKNRYFNKIKLKRYKSYYFKNISEPKIREKWVTYINSYWNSFQIQKIIKNIMYFLLKNILNLYEKYENYDQYKNLATI